MSILGTVLTAPVLGPIKGLLWLARTIEEQANGELYDPDKIRGELAELELALELKQIDAREYDRQEELLLKRLREIREARND
ncbi:MAG: gas vesicle protein GvpG [Xanthobacteraceae bacterium]|nr:gas vesicle protein GvpG [Xanthobacteraceae bacterium]